MDVELIEKFKHLPNDLINIIINYTDVIVYRYGKYINRISSSDYRYKILEKIPLPIKIGSSRYLLKLINMTGFNKQGYFLEYIIGFYIKVNVKFVIYEVDGFDRYIETKSFLQYIFDSNCNWSKTVYYPM